MAPKFNFDPAKDIPDLTGRVLLITGGTNGIGRTAIEQLLPHKPRAIYFTGRNQTAADEVVSAAASSSTAVRFLKCDLASLASVKKCAADFLAQSDRLDVLICNAGIMTVPPALTDDGYEAQWGTNHMGHALLINLLLPVLKATVSNPVPADGQSDKSDVRILILTSLAARAINPHREGIDLNDLSNPTVTGYSYPRLLPVLSPWVAYGRSKLANLLYAQELARRLVDDGILVVAVHPGVVMTNLVNGQGWFNRWFVKLTTIGNQIEPEQGSWNMLWALSAPRKGMESGKKYSENWGAEKLQVVSGGVYEPVGVPSYALGSMTWYQEDNDLKKRLWEWTAKELERWMV